MQVWQSSGPPRITSTRGLSSSISPWFPYSWFQTVLLPCCLLKTGIKQTQTPHWTTHCCLVPKIPAPKAGLGKAANKDLFFVFFNPSLRQVPKGFVATQPQVPPPAFTWARVTWRATRVRPIRREDRCPVFGVSQAETCWFSRRRPPLINWAFFKNFFEERRTSIARAIEDILYPSGGGRDEAVGRSVGA